MVHEHANVFRTGDFDPAHFQERAFGLQIQVVNAGPIDRAIDDLSGTNGRLTRSASQNLLYGVHMSTCEMS